MTEIVRTEGLVKRYDGTLAVAGVDLTVDEGEIFGLVGPNGAGKTTTLRILATLLSPSAGSAEIAGMSVTRNPDQVRRVIGFMPDAFGVYDDMKVWEYLDFFARCYGIAPAARRRVIADLLELVDLGDKREAYVQTLSRGMQQRLCLAHALVHDPASTRAPGSSFASSCASCARWARRSSSAATSSRSWRSCARAS